MKKLVLILTLVCICAFAAPAFANPFSDVAADHWAYDAIDKLADDGIVVGNPDGTYKGNKTMTRYEMATLVARAMAASEADDAKITAENKALIDKLAAEFGTELDALGVRVTALENKVGNVKLTGFAGIRMVHKDFDGYKNKDDKDQYQMKVNLNAAAQVNDKVTVNARLTTYNDDGSTWIDMTDTDGSVVSAEFDHYNVKYAGDKVVAIVGRDSAFLGKGTIIDDNLLGAQLVVPFGNEKQYTFAAITGRLDGDDTGFIEAINPAGKHVEELNLTAFELNGKVGKVGLGFDYGWVEAMNNEGLFDKNLTEDKANVFGVNADYAFNDKVNVWAEYVKTDIERNAKNGKEKDDDAILVGVNYQAHPRLGFDLTYGCVGGASVIPGISTWSDGLDVDNFYLCEKADMWKVGVNYDLMKNVKLYANYWNVACDGNTANEDKDYQRIETGLNFKF